MGKSPPANRAKRPLSGLLRSCAVSRVWNGLGQSSGFIIQSSPADLDWTGSEICQLSGFWIGLDREMCNVEPIFRDLKQFLPIVTLTSEVLPSNISANTHRLSVHVDFTRYFKTPSLLCLDWAGLDSDSGSSAGLNWIRISDSWIWTRLDLFNSIQFILWLSGDFPKNK